MTPFTETTLAHLLPAPLMRTLKASGRTTTYADGQFIHNRGNQEAGLSIILFGHVRFGIYDPAGSYTQASILGEGHCFGEATLFMDAPRAYDAESLGSTSLLTISAEMMKRLMADHADLSQALLRTLTHRLYAALDVADDLRTASKEDRVEKHLRRLIQMGGFDDNVLPIRQIDLAFALGLSRVSVGKALDTLQNRGVIRLGYGEIEILSPSE